MYQNIYQVSTKPIKREQRISAESFWDMDFIGEIANHVADVTERETELQTFDKWLTEQKLGSLDKNSFVLTEEGINGYFSKKYARFKELAHKIAGTPEQKFLSEPDDMENLLSDLNNAFSDRFDIYIFHENSGLQPVSSFLRKAVIGQKYYIGGICKYQY